VVTVLPGWRTMQAVRAIRRTLAFTRARGRWRTTDFTFACLTIAGRSGAVSATWTAPPPMTAPPQVQAQSFAKAILTDISRTLFQVAVTPNQWESLIRQLLELLRQMPKIRLSASALTMM
jgi:hypothetical protein